MQLQPQSETLDAATTRANATPERNRDLAGPSRLPSRADSTGLRPRNTEAARPECDRELNSEPRTHAA